MEQKAFDRYQLFCNQNYGHVVQLLFEPLFNSDAALADAEEADLGFELRLSVQQRARHEELPSRPVLLKQDGEPHLEQKRRCIASPL